MVQKSARVLTASLVILGLLFTSAAPAAADTQGADTETFTSDTLRLTVESAVDEPTESGQYVSTARVDFSCTVKVNYPHGSHHVDGTINVQSTVKCDIPVARMRLATELYRVSPSARYVGKPVVKQDVNFVKSNAATSCSAGPARFQGLAIATMQVPAGFKLRGEPKRTERGKVLYVKCGTSSAASAAQSANDEDAAETWELHFVREGARSE